MYPYRSKLRWLAFGRYAHLAKAVNTRRSGLQDSLLEARVEALVHWSRIRFVVSIILSLGIVAAGAAWLARLLPAFEAAYELLGGVAATSSALAGILTLAYLFLSRLLGQIEVDILTILVLGHGK